jgi:type IV pilus assembly protein PilC
MWLSRELSAVHLVRLCHLVRHSVDAGVPLTKVFRQQAENGPPAVRPVAGRIAAHLENGHDLQRALKDERDTVPPLVVALVAVGEQTGALPEAFAELEQYFQLQTKLQRQFRSQVLGPLLLWGVAVLVFALVMVVLDMLKAPGGAVTGPTVFGLGGVPGAALFVALNYGGLFAIVVLYTLLRQALGRAAGLQRVLLRLPVAGPCLRALALGRFALALSLTLGVGLAVGKALRQSLAATGNGAFTARADAVVEVVKRGDDLTLALAASRLFPPEFLAVAAVAEEAGRVPEVMRKQAAEQFDEAARRLKALTRALVGLVWLVYVIFLVSMILRLAGVYTSALGG